MKSAITICDDFEGVPQFNSVLPNLKVRWCGDGITRLSLGSYDTHLVTTCTARTLSKKQQYKLVPCITLWWHPFGLLCTQQNDALER
jgi:hypothetical protein